MQHLTQYLTRRSLILDFQLISTENCTFLCTKELLNAQPILTPSEMARRTDQDLPNEDQGPVILGATLTVTTAALITLVTRLYVRIRMIHNMGWDDFVMISAMVLVCHSHPPA